MMHFESLHILVNCVKQTAATMVMTDENYQRKFSNATVFFFVQLDNKEILFLHQSFSISSERDIDWA